MQTNKIVYSEFCQKYFERCQFDYFNYNFVHFSHQALLHTKNTQKNTQFDNFFSESNYEYKEYIIFQLLFSRKLDKKIWAGIIFISLIGGLNHI